MRSTCVRLPSIALAFALGAAGCAGVATPAPSAAPSAVPVTESPRPAPTAVATHAATATPSLAPSPTPLPTPTLPPQGRWAPLDDQSPFAESMVTAAVANADRYIAVADVREGVYATAWTSVDGLRWDRVEMPPSAQEEAGAPRAGVDTVVRDRIGYLAGGRAYDDMKDRSTPAIWTSADGLAWRRVPEIPGSADSLISGFARLGDQLFAIGVANVHELDNGRLAVWTSSDGESWRRVDGIHGIPSDYWCRPRVTTFRGQLMAWGCEYFLTSRDGRSWVRRRLKTGTGDDRSIGSATDVLVDGRRLVAVGSRGCTPLEARGWGSGPCTYPAAWTSTDGKAWHLAAFKDPRRIGDLNRSLQSVARGRSMLVAIWSGGAAWESADGSTWYRSTTAPSDCTALAAGPDGIVCLGEEAWIQR